jgi:hypothetical protein
MDKMKLHEETMTPIGEQLKNEIMKISQYKSVKEQYAAIAQLSQFTMVNTGERVPFEAVFRFEGVLRLCLQ